MNYYLEVFRKYAVFKGRARRAEYWYFYLFSLIISFALSIIGALVGDQTTSVLFLLYSLAILVPSIAVTIRRLHDTGKNGWWIFISLIPIIGGIWLFVLSVRDSQPGENKYGPNPKKIITN